jgi:hypothetical protein
VAPPRWAPRHWRGGDDGSGGGGAAAVSQPGGHWSLFTCGREGGRGRKRRGKRSTSRDWNLLRKTPPGTVAVGSNKWTTRSPRPRPPYGAPNWFVPPRRLLSRRLHSHHYQGPVALTGPRPIARFDHGQSNPKYCHGDSESSATCCGSSLRASSRSPTPSSASSRSGSPPLRRLAPIMQAWCCRCFVHRYKYFGFLHVEEPCRVRSEIVGAACLLARCRCQCHSGISVYFFRMKEYYTILFVWLMIFPRGILWRVAHFECSTCLLTNDGTVVLICGTVFTDVTLSIHLIGEIGQCLVMASILQHI